MRHWLIVAVLLASCIAAWAQDTNWPSLMGGSNYVSAWRWATQAGTNALDSITNRHPTLRGTTTWTTRPNNASAITTLSVSNYAQAPDTFTNIYALPKDTSDSGSWAVGMWVLITNAVNTVLFTGGCGEDHYGEGGHNFVFSWEYSLKRIRMTVRTASSNNSSVLSPNNSADFAGNGWQFVGFGYNRVSAKYDIFINDSQVRTQLNMGPTYWQTNGTPTLTWGQRSITTPYDTPPAAVGDTFMVVGRWMQPEEWTNMYYRMSTNYVSAPPAVPDVDMRIIKRRHEMLTQGR